MPESSLYCPCVQVLGLVLERSGLTNAGLDGAYTEAQLYVARQLGWLEAGEGAEALRLRLRGRGGRRALLNRILKVEKPRGARRTALSDPSALQRCEEWVAHLAAPSQIGGKAGTRGISGFRRHLGAVLDQLPHGSRDDLRLSASVRQMAFQALDGAVREILPDLNVGRRRTGLAKRVLAALSGRSIESVQKAMGRVARGFRLRDPPAGFVELLVVPPLSPTEGRIFVNFSLLHELSGDVHRGPGSRPIRR